MPELFANPLGFERRFSKCGNYHRISRALGFQALIKRFVIRTVIARTIFLDLSEPHADYLLTMTAIPHEPVEGYLKTSCYRENK